MELEQLAAEAVILGAYKAGIIEVDKIPFEAELRKSCEVNYCGNFGRNWMCPPHVGDIDTLIQRAKGYKYALVYQTVSDIEDSFDYEGMVAAGKRHKEITDLITAKVKEGWQGPILQLSAGGCPVCEKCAKREEQPCRHPDKALASLEAYGIYVSKLSALCNMNYINGQNTVTYFGAYFFS